MQRYLVTAHHKNLVDTVHWEEVPNNVEISALKCFGVSHSLLQQMMYVTQCNSVYRILKVYVWYMNKCTVSWALSKADTVRTQVVCPLERGVPNSNVVHTHVFVIREGGSVLDASVIFHWCTHILRSKGYTPETWTTVLPPMTVTRHSSHTLAPLMLLQTQKATHKYM